MGEPSLSKGGGFQEGLDFLSDVRADGPGDSATGFDAKGVAGLDLHHGREASDVLEGAPDVLADLMRQTRAGDGLSGPGDLGGDIEPVSSWSREGEARAVAVDCPGFHGRLATMSISTSAPTARAVTPIVVRAGRRSSGK